MLNDYIPRFGDNVTGLTGSKETIKKLPTNIKYFTRLFPKGMTTPLIIPLEYTLWIKREELD